MTEQQPVRNINDLIAAGQVAKPEQQLNAEGKEALARAGTVFTVLSVEASTDAEYGEAWDFHAETAEGPVSFRLYANEKRDPFIIGLASLLDAGPIGGLRLNTASTRKGNAFVWIEPAV